MNIPVEHFVQDLERSARELPNVLAEWADLHEELRQAYSEQLTWMLEARPKVLARAASERCFMAMNHRISIAARTMYDYREQVEAQMGIPASIFYPCLTWNGSDPPTVKAGVELPVAVLGCDMPRLLAFMASEGVALDQLTSRFTIFNAVDAFLLPAVPARVVRLVLLCQYALGTSDEAFEEQVRLLSPTGAEVARSASSVELRRRDPSSLPNCHLSLHVFWAPLLNEVGDHVLELSTRERSEDSWVVLATREITAVIQNHPILNAQDPSVSTPIPPSTAPTTPVDAPSSEQPRRSTPA